MPNFPINNSMPMNISINFVHWSTINFYDIFTVFYITLLVVVVIASNNIFAMFVAAKPEGRKTAVGKCGQVFWEINFCFQQK